jgi:hypothetical protein
MISMISRIVARLVRAWLRIAGQPAGTASQAVNNAKSASRGGRSQAIRRR